MMAQWGPRAATTLVLCGIAWLVLNYTDEVCGVAIIAFIGWCCWCCAGPILRAMGLL